MGEGDYRKRTAFDTLHEGLPVSCGTSSGETSSTDSVEVCCAGVPFWLTGLELVLASAPDRFTLPFMLSASLLGALLLTILPLPRWAKIIPLAVALGFAVGLQFQHGIVYRRDWSVQNAFFWQLSWRAPALQPGTVLLANELPVEHYTDNSLSAPLNWIYDPANTPERMKYILFYPSLRKFENWMNTLQKDQPIQRDYLATTFYGSSSQVIVLYFNPPGCLRVLDPEVEVDNWMLPENLRLVIPLSTSEPILPMPPTDQPAPRLPQNIFDPEPARTWCYFFEKADLARQVGDWQTVTTLGDQAFAAQDYPNDPAERLPFIEGYAHTGNWQRALELSRDTRAITNVMSPVLCRLWQRIDRETSPSPEKQQALDAVRSENNCAP